MHRFRLRGWAAVGVAFAAAGVAVADPPASNPPTDRGLFARMNPFAAPDPGPRVKPTAAGPLSEETLLTVLQAEKDAYARRMDVCLRLKEIALQSNDDKLEAKANELEKQATAVYHERVARLGVRGSGPLPPMPLPTPPTATASLDKTLGSGVAKTPLDSATKPAGKTATAKASPFKEVAP